MHPVKVNPHGGGDILLERFREVGDFPVVPGRALVAEAPALVVLAQEVDEGVHVQAGGGGAHAEHHAEGKERNYGFGSATYNRSIVSVNSLNECQ